MDLSTLGSLAIIGAIVSLLTSAIKKWAETSKMQSKYLAIGVSLVGAIVYYFLQSTVFWKSLLVNLPIIFGYANVVYLFLVQFLDNKIEQVVNPEAAKVNQNI